jgi:prepilin-type N-terminal cleavage/methylation domain-containing protein/prepilin-type processing-associated H-X9-DG protein
MRTQKKGFTLIELLVVIAIIAILASILFPIFAKARAKARQAVCTSNLKQLSMAIAMYTQDNKNRLPGLYKRQADGTVSSTYTGWAGDVITYVRGGSDVTTPSEIFYCQEMAQGDIELPVSYGFNGCLLKTDGTGVNEAAIKSPSQVGVLCDANPGVPFPAVTTSGTVNTYGGGGVVGGYSMIFSAAAATEKMGSKLTVKPAGRHSDGVVVGYADGHAQIVPDKYNEKDSTNGVVRAFYMAPALGLVDNPAAGLGGTVDQPFGTITAAATGKSYTVIGGDPVTRPILMAACEVGKKMMTGFTYSDDGFNGSLNTDTRPSDYLEGVVTPAGAPLTGPFVQAGGSNVQIGIDAMVVVVNKNSAIKLTQAAGATPLANIAYNIDLTKKSFSRSGGAGTWRQITIGELQGIIQSDGYGALDSMVNGNMPANAVADSHDWQLYLQNKTDGTRSAMAATTATFTTAGGFGAYYKDGGTPDHGSYALRCTGLTKNDDADSYRGTYCANDMEIVDKVANDTLGIGIVSAAYADQKKVDILAVSFGSAATTATFPTSNVRQDPGVYPNTCTWQFRRNLYAYRGANTTAGEAVSTLCFTTKKTAFAAGPLYKASFWPMP